MYGRLSDQSLVAMTLATTESKKFHQNYLGTEHLFIGLCKVEDPEMQDGFGRASIDPVYWRRKVRAEIITSVQSNNHEVAPTPRCEKVLKLAEKIASKESAFAVSPRHLFLAILLEGQGIPARILRDNGISLEELIQCFAQPTFHPQTSVARSFPFLSRFGRNLTQLAKEGKLPPTVGRKDQMLLIGQSLRRKNKGSVLVIGHPGTGKSSLVQGFAQIACANDANDALKNLIVFEIQLSALVSGTKFRGDFEERMQSLIREASSDPNLILFLDEFHLIRGAGASGEAMDAANILKPVLASGAIHCIGATTIEEYRKHVEPDDALTRRFDVLTLPEPTAKETLDILGGIRESFEKHHNVTIADNAIEAAVNLADRYISDRCFPDKAIDLLDRACANAVLSSIHQRVDSQQKHTIDRARIVAVLKQIMDISIPEDYLQEDNQNRLNTLEERLNQSVLGQTDAVRSVSRVILTHCAGLSSANRPIGAFLFAGPTGVGKTELARSLAIHFFGTERKLLRFDMSEYTEQHSVSKLLGSPPGYVGHEEEGLLSKLVRTNPHSVILFDEIEKAHPEIDKVFLQILEPGTITDNHGNTIRFSQSIVIFTSNLGSSHYWEQKPRQIGIRKDKEVEDPATKLKERVLAEINARFAPEFRNRLDEIILFQPLVNKEILQKLVLKLVAEIRSLLLERGMEMTIDPEAIEYLLNQGYTPEYGARHLRRTLDQLIRSPLAYKLNSGQFSRGDVIRVTVENDTLTFVH